MQQQEVFQKFDSMQDSEFLAFYLASHFEKENNQFVSEYVFARLVKILEYLSKQEKN